MNALPEPLAVTNWIWRGETPSPAPDLHDARDVAAALAECTGQFAIHQASPDGTHRLARDPLGVNKLFFAVTPEGDVVAANHLIELRRRGLPMAAISSVPSGHWLELRPASRGFALSKWAALPFGSGPANPAAVAEHAPRIRAALEATFRRLRASLAGRSLYVTLSGGLDSTTIAVLAREWLGDFVGVTFAVEPAGGGAVRSDDLACAERLARELGVAFEVVTATPKGLIDLLDPVLLYGQDWRDFNVHCGLVNAAIGAALARRHERPDAPERTHANVRPAGPEGPDAAKRPVVLTGDVMNELMADYTPVTHDGKTYYDLPRMSPARLRRFLVGGLDAGDREVGIFAHYGIDAIQPYALCAAAYAALPGACLDFEAVKQQLVRAVMGARIPSFVYARPKVRAQVADEHGVGGTLAALVDAGLDQAFLARRFAELFGVTGDELPRLIRAGFYRFATRYPETPLHG